MRLSFRPLAEEDLAQLARWLAEPHVREWWHDPSDLDAVRDKYLPCIRAEEPTEVFVIVLEGGDLGIMERYRLSTHPDWAHTIAATGHSYANAAGIDYFIGVRDAIGRGTGTQAVEDFTRLLFADYPDIEQVVVTPQLGNRASCRALEKSGYELMWTGRLESDDPSDAGTAALYVQRRSSVTQGGSAGGSARPE
ncbi:MAG: GNAT family N-acetyltransferase [Acidimicrobiales bacterium]